MRERKWSLANGYDKTAGPNDLWSELPGDFIPPFNALQRIAPLLDK